MKLVPVIVSIIFAAGIIGYGAEASAQQSSTPCTASYPCAKICGDHPCAPGEVYMPGAASTSTNATVKTSTTATVKTNATVAPSSTQIGIGANVTATVKKSGMSNATMMANATSMTMHPTANATKVMANATIGMNATMAGGMQKGLATNTTATMTITAKIESPTKQVSSGTAPADVKCPSGYQLALNKFDSRPACVSADVMAKLVARGWASQS